MLDAHAYVMQVKLCKANTRGVTASLQLLTHLWIKISGTLISWIWNHMKGIVIYAIMIPL